MSLENLAGKNINAPVKELRHADLRRSDESRYRSVCPACQEGFLLVGRDPKTLELLEFDLCVLCGQQVRYLDIETLRNG